MAVGVAEAEVQPIRCVACGTRIGRVVAKGAMRFYDFGSVPVVSEGSPERQSWCRGCWLDERQPDGDAA